MLYTCKTNLKKLSKIDKTILDEMCNSSRALYNSGLYELNQYFNEHKKYLGFGKLDKLMKNHKSNPIYRYLPAQISQQILKRLDKNFVSFFKLLSKKNQNDYDKKIKTPKYLKKSSKYNLIFQKQSFRVKNNKIYLSISKFHKNNYNKKFIEINLPEYIKEQNIKQIEIKPFRKFYKAYIVYEKEIIKETKTQLKNWLSIDLGLNNFCTITSNCFKPILLNGKHIKSINQFYNKKKSKIQGELKKCNNKHWSNKLEKLTEKRNNKIEYEIFQIIKILNKIIENFNIDTVVCGYNKEWKQKIKIGKKNNQNFTQIPFNSFLHKLTYKLNDIGIEVILNEESYTSKCSFFDNEEIKKHNVYKGKRIKRGLFNTNKGYIVNADVNGSLNIFKKVIKNLKQEVQDALFKPLDIGFVVNPIKITNFNELDMLINKKCLI